MEQKVDIVPAIESGGLGMINPGSQLYVPGESFSSSRTDKGNLSTRGTLLIVVGIVLFIGWLWLVSGTKMSNRWYMGAMFLSISMYGWTLKKSVAVHEDVDYVTNSNLENLLSMEIDEHVCVSYQNFDPSEESLEDRLLLFVMTNRQVYFAENSGYGWAVMRQHLRDIVGFGVDANLLGALGRQGAQPKVKFVFRDGQTIFFEMNIDNKITSTPELVVKQIIQTLDSHLTGAFAQSGTQRRRRVTGVEVQTPAATPGVATPPPFGGSTPPPMSGEMPLRRSIDLSISGELMETLRAAEMSALSTRRPELETTLPPTPPPLPNTPTATPPPFNDTATPPPSKKTATPPPFNDTATPAPSKETATPPPFNDTATPPPFNPGVRRGIEL